MSLSFHTSLRVCAKSAIELPGVLRDPALIALLKIREVLFKTREKRVGRSGIWLWADISPSWFPAKPTSAFDAWQLFIFIPLIKSATCSKLLRIFLQSAQYTQGQLESKCRCCLED